MEKTNKVRGDILALLKKKSILCKHEHGLTQQKFVLRKIGNRKFSKKIVKFTTRKTGCCYEAGGNTIEQGKKR